MYFKQTEQYTMFESNPENKENHPEKNGIFWRKSYRDGNVWKGFARYADVYIPETKTKPAAVREFFKHLSSSTDAWNFEKDPELKFDGFLDPEDEKATSMDEIPNALRGPEFKHTRDGFVSTGAASNPESHLSGARLKQEEDVVDEDEEMEEDPDDDFQEWEFCSMAFPTSGQLLHQTTVSPTIPQLHLKQISNTNCRSRRIQSTFGNSVACTLKTEFGTRFKNLPQEMRGKSFVQMSKSKYVK